jgi:hypothetical protein
VQLAENDAVSIINGRISKNVVANETPLTPLASLLREPSQAVTMRIERRDDVV